MIVIVALSSLYSLIIFLIIRRLTGTGVKISILFTSVTLLLLAGIAIFASGYMFDFGGMGYLMTFSVFIGLLLMGVFFFVSFISWLYDLKTNRNKTYKSVK